MKFEKGNSGNPLGRPKGSKNKAGEELRNLISHFLEPRFAGIVKDYKSLSPRDRIKVYTNLLQFALTKLQSISTDPGFEKFSDEDLDKIVAQIIEQYEAA
jgi:Family of unknown function (DUF5681)